VTSPASNQDLWTTRRLMAWMIDTFTRKDLDSPRIQAEMLLEHVFGCRRLSLYTDPDRPASNEERQRLRDLVTRALKHEPVQYLVGEAKFFGLDFKVDPRVLVPRPSTATIVEEVLQHHRAAKSGVAIKGEGMLIADVCTGSGCIAITLLRNLPAARGVATDLSPDALEVARLNAARLAVQDRLEFAQGHLLDPLAELPATRGVDSLDYLVSNPPYIPDDEWAAVEPNVKDYEPHLALRGGVDGLDLVRPLLERGPALVKPGGLILVEIATSRAEEALSFAKANPQLGDVRLLSDIDGLARVVVGRRV
jgi:release factor glutamine methyltransferase